MKLKDKQEIRQLDVKALKKRATDLRHRLAAYSANQYTKPSKNLHEGKALRKELALLLTYIRQKETTHGS